MSILLVEQNARMALKLASRAIVLEHGKRVLSGPSNVLMQDPTVQQAFLGRSSLAA